MKKWEKEYARMINDLTECIFKVSCQQPGLLIMICGKVGDLIAVWDDNAIPIGYKIFLPKKNYSGMTKEQTYNFIRSQAERWPIIDINWS